MTANISKKSEKKFIVITVILSLSISLLTAEWLLRYQREIIENSDKMDPGMMLYDAQLGWKLKPYWSGKHHHFDYDAKYTINESGFRGISTASGDSIYAVVGDSFSFGLGVNDDETFTALLNRNSETVNSFKNFSVPGYSTDQQLLLINRYRPYIGKQVLLVVYLGNDVFDVTRAYPLQADHGKPYFELTNNSLVLKNTPVPLAPKPTQARNDTIFNIVLGSDYREKRFFSLLSKLEISRRLGLYSAESDLSDEVMQRQFADSLSLLLVLIEEIQRIVENNQGKLDVVLLPGRSYVEQPSSNSAKYQEFFREYIHSSLDKESTIKVIDLAMHLRSLHNKGINGLFFPNEGHLTASGHKYIAEYLLTQISLPAVTDQSLP